MIKRFASTVAIAFFALALGVLTTTGVAASSPAGPAVTPDTVTVDLSPKGESGIEGKARLVHGEEELQVGLSATGVEAGTEYPAHIHQGTCENGGGVVADVGPVTKASQDAETGEAATTVALEKLMQAKEKSESEHPSFFLQVHLPDGTPAACGDITKEKEEKEENGDR